MDLAYFRLGKAWKWVKKMWSGSIEISQPSIREVIGHQPWVEIKGTSTRPKDRIHWLLTKDKGDRYWPQTRISVAPDGQWKERVNVNKKVDRRDDIIVVAEVNKFAESIFMYWRENGVTLNWKPLPLHEEAGTFKPVRSIVITVLGSSNGASSND